VKGFELSIVVGKASLFQFSDELCGLGIEVVDAALAAEFNCRAFVLKYDWFAHASQFLTGYDTGVDWVSRVYSRFARFGFVFATGGQERGTCDYSEEEG